ncbi:hypothetical protein J3B02_001004 [Coemansia erecta]|nr:hypothetical protein J3B02_001004 [Coemansia erecta]
MELMKPIARGHLIDDPTSTRVGQMGSFDSKSYKTRVKSTQGSQWSGPGQQDMWTDSNYIDVSLDRQTWTWLRNIQISRNQLETNDSQSELGRRKSLASSISAQKPVFMRMLASEEKKFESEDSLLQLDANKPHELQGDSQGWMINVGMPVLTVDWLPVRPAGHREDDAGADFVAIGGMAPGSDLCSCLEQTSFERDKDQTPGIVQIWRTDITASSGSSGACRLDMVLAHSFGDCWAIRWCPISIPPSSHSQRDNDAVPVLGVLAAIFADGYLRVIPVPRADSLRAATNQQQQQQQPVFVQWPRWSLAEIKAPRGVFTAFEWATSDVLIAGTSTGLVTAWSVETAASAQFTRLNKDPRCKWPYTWHPDPMIQSWCSTTPPMANHQVHAGTVITLSTYASDPELCNKRSPRASGDVRLTDPSKIQVFSSGRDGRIHQTLLSLPARHNHVFVNMPGHLRCCQLSWLLTRVLYTDGDNCLRINHDPMTRSADPVIQSSVFEINSNAEVAQKHTSEVPDWVMASSTGILNPEGALCHVSMSHFHTYLAAGSTDGTLDIQNIARIDTGRKGSPMFRRVYGLLWDRARGDQALACRGRGPVKVRANPTKHYLTQIYPPQVAIQTSVWSKNPLSATWIASAGIGGILRIDNIGGSSV